MHTVGKRLQHDTADEAESKMFEFINFLERQAVIKIKTIRADGGGEFIAKKTIKELR
jgi:hypothetical protein